MSFGRERDARKARRRLTGALNSNFGATHCGLELRGFAAPARGGAGAADEQAVIAA
jgi:hypothetical protein